MNFGKIVPTGRYERELIVRYLGHNYIVPQKINAR